MSMKDCYSDELRSRLTQMKTALYGTHHVTDEFLLCDLLDLCQFSHLSAYQHWLKLIKLKISKGVTRRDLFQMKLIYTFLGHFLQRLREL